MLLRFVGENGSMGLVRGIVYDVDIISGHKYVYVKWVNEKGNFVQCPYSSIEQLVSSWMTPSYDKKNRRRMCNEYFY
jgi:hypothetical protein